jgi:hypothetical protein
MSAFDCLDLGSQPQWAVAWGEVVRSGLPTSFSLRGNSRRTTVVGVVMVDWERIAQERQAHHIKSGKPFFEYPIVVNSPTDFAEEARDGFRTCAIGLAAPGEALE